MTITQKEAVAKFLPVIEAEGKNYKKSAVVDVRSAQKGEVIVTIVNGIEETKKTAEEGDWVIKNPGGEEYVVPEKVFTPRYKEIDEPSAFEGYKRYQASGRIRAVTFDSQSLGLQSPFKFNAVWGEEMIIEDGDKIVTTLPEKNEVYRIEKQAFVDTYTKDNDQQY